MPVNISYMGTKRELAPIVSEIIDIARPGPILDAFSGMCSVAEAVAYKRQVWTNDAQIFAYEVGKALFTSKDEPLRPVPTADYHFDLYKTHCHSLRLHFESPLSLEDTLLESTDFESFSDRYSLFKSSLACVLEKCDGRDFNLFSTLYSDSFFGLRQTLQADAIIRSIHKSHKLRRITGDERRWLLIGLGRAMLRVSNSTGHFAQFLKPKANSYSVFMRQRRRCLWAEWLAAMDNMEAVGTSTWRQRNKSFNQDALLLLEQLVTQKARPGVIYADPPYTDDQYSRFYHVLETLMLYDYPTLTGFGRYRTDRFQTSFSVKSQATTALSTFVELAAATGADLVLSYPTNGLACQKSGDLSRLMRKHFTKVEKCRKICYQHSTFGASKGPSKSAVIEQIYLGRN